MAEQGSIWINLDDNEAHYCKVLCDEVFGRANFLADVIWEKADSPRMDAEFFSTRHDHIFVYAKNRGSFAINKGVAVGRGWREKLGRRRAWRQNYPFSFGLNVRRAGEAAFPSDPVDT